MQRKSNASVAAAQHSLTNDSEIFLYAQAAARNLWLSPNAILKWKKRKYFRINEKKKDFASRSNRPYLLHRVHKSHPIVPPNLESFVFDLVVFVFVFFTYIYYKVLVLRRKSVLIWNKSNSYLERIESMK